MANDDVDASPATRAAPFVAGTLPPAPGLWAFQSDSTGARRGHLRGGAMNPVFRSEELVVFRETRGYRVEVPGIATFAVALDGSCLELVARDASASDELVAVARDHYVAPRTHQLRGAPTLHGSAVVRGGVAVAFLGLSGSGKSTLAAHLGPQGAFLADDAILLRGREGAFEVVPTTTKARLREGSASAFGATVREGAPWTRFIQRFPEAQPAPLARIYVLEDGPDVAITPLGTRDALLALTRFVHRLDPNDAALLAGELTFLSALARAPGLRRLAFPTRFEVLDDVARAIDRDLDGATRGGST